MLPDIGFLEMLARVGGIGFLGAGSIIQSRGAVHGVTTAARVWVAGAIGVACGVGSYAIATAVAILAVVTLAVLGPLERRWGREE
jgi:putative Mg2+ transporter-C (MgtC) family protein